MSWRIQIEKRALKALEGLSAADQQRVRKAIHGLAEDPRPRGCKRLEDSEYWRIRVGVYRVVFYIEKKRLLILVVRIGHRREVHR